jgi:hypothetical protein
VTQRASHFFDIESAEQFFILLKATHSKFIRSKGKATKDLMFLVMGLTHLREWIAPGYRHDEKEATSAEELFHNAIYLELNEFKILQGLCNRSKHMKASSFAMAPSYGAKLDDWPELDSIMSMERGPPTAYFVDGMDIDDVLRAVIEFYESRWFSKLRPVGASEK